MKILEIVILRLHIINSTSRRKSTVVDETAEKKRRYNCLLSFKFGFMVWRWIDRKTRASADDK